MKLTRHSFLRVSGTALVGQGLTGFPSLGSLLEPWVTPQPGRHSPGEANAAPRPDEAPATGAAVFRPHVNTTFMFHGSGGLVVPLVLARVVERPVDARLEQFSLIFTASSGSAPPDGIYRLQHPELDPFDLFIAPVGGPHSRRPACEACFCRCRDARAGGEAWPSVT